MLTVGRLSPKKGHAFALRALREAGDRLGDFEYTIIGDGELWRKLQAEVAGTPLQRRVRFLGPQPRDRIAQELVDTDVLLAPSVTPTNGDEEGIPMVLMEAMARQVPVVATHHGGNAELVDDGHTGLLVPEWDVGALVDGLIAVKHGPEEAAARAVRGRQAVVRSFNLDVQLGELEDLAGSLADQKRKAEGSW
jgi:colanic acid/amylovoran biosynthesis glycosyltransferase